MARTFTQYWQNSTWEDYQDGAEPLDHSASNEFKRRGVERGDRIFIVTNIEGALYLGNVMLVDKLVGQREAQKQRGPNLWKAKDHVLAREGRPFYKDLRVPIETVKALRYRGNKSLVFKKAGQLDQQTLRGVRELTDESVEMLQALLDEREAGKLTTENLLEVPKLGRLFGDELVLEFEILQRMDLSETQKQALVNARRGQGIFRDNVLRVEPRCRVTGIDDPNYLIASHIKPWSESSNAERLSENNGLMLTPHVDHIFDKGYISFTDSGELLVSAKCAVEVLATWGISPTINVGPFRSAQRPFLAYHRDHRFKS